MYIQWPVEIDDLFRPAYLAETSEEVALMPLCNNTDTHYMIGSSRVTEEQCKVLQEMFPDVYFGTMPSPDWTPKIDEL